MKKGMLYLLFFTFFLSFQQTGTLISVSSDEFARYIKKYGESQLIDVRTPAEYNNGHIKHAHLVNIYDSDFKQKINNLGLDKSKPVLVYCRSGNRSLIAGRYLTGLGYDVINLKFGIIEWEKSGKPVEK